MANAPPPVRKRLIIEGYECQANVTPDLVDLFLVTLTGVMDMRMLAGPFVVDVPPAMSAEPGVSGTLIWFESGVHVHHWENSGFVAVDMFSCKDIDYSTAEHLFMKFFEPDDLYCHIPIVPLKGEQAQ